MATRVMLADNSGWNESKVQRHLNEVGSLIMQPKIDGMRVYIGDARIPLSRSGKEWKQRHLRQFCQDHPSLVHCDGEVIAGLTYNPESFRTSMSGIRAEDGAPEFTYYVFDFPHPEWADISYTGRRETLERVIAPFVDRMIDQNEYTAKLVLCPQRLVVTLEEIYAHEIELLAAGWEGAILRRADRPYKFGRSTINEGALLKLKRFEDAEAVVVGYEPWEQNNNEATTSPLGYTVRSSHQENRQALERLGVLKVELLTDRSVKFGIGVMRGVTHDDRDRLWANRDALLGRICKFVHQGYGGGYDVPRTPVFIGWREAVDL